MTYKELNAILRNEKFPIAVKPLKTLISAGFAHLQPTDFEAFVLGLFETLNFSGSLTPVTGDGGIDILLDSADGAIVIQCKKYDDNGIIGAKDLREFLGALVHAKAVHGYFVTTSSFSSQAKDFINEHDNVTLIDGECLKKLFTLSVYLFVANYEIYKYEVVDIDKDVNDFGQEYQIQAEGLYREYIRELNKIKAKFAHRKRTV